MRIPEIGLGTYKITEELTAGKTRNIVETALRTGYRYIDTAAFYGNETEIGEAIRKVGVPREELMLQTKVWKTDLGYEKTARAIDASLKRLNVDYVDIMLIHWPLEFPGDPDWKEKVQGSYKAIEDAVKAGKVRAPGLSNFLPHHIMTIREVSSIEPVVDQLELHAGYMQQHAVDYCRKLGIVPQAWSPLGRLRVVKHPTILRLSEKYGVTPADLLLRFLLQQGISVVPKATSEEHLRSNLHPAEFTLTAEDISVLLNLPRIGWGGEHPDYTREEVDNRYLG